MKLDSKLIEAAKNFVTTRYPSQGEVGAAAMYTEVGAAAMYTEDGEILISVSPNIVSAEVELCHEVGAICEATKLGKKITASVCVTRLEDGRFFILSPCGICRERLMAWGDEVECAVPMDHDPTLWQSKKLRDLLPYYWRRPFT